MIEDINNILDEWYDEIRYIPIDKIDDVFLKTKLYFENIQNDGKYDTYIEWEIDLNDRKDMAKGWNLTIGIKDHVSNSSNYFLKKVYIKNTAYRS